MVGKTAPINEEKFREFEETLEDNLYFTDEGIEDDGCWVTIPKKYISMVKTWSALCIDPNEGEDYYKNPRAMFMALLLIYRLTDSIEISPCYSCAHWEERSCEPSQQFNNKSCPGWKSK